MNLQRMIVGCAVLCCIALSAVDAGARVISTFDLGGADAEIRDSQPTSNRGGSTELASRLYSLQDGTGGQNSKMYIKFGVQDITAAELLADITVRLTYRQENLVEDRITDTTNGTGNTGLDYYVLDPNHNGANWNEMTITPRDAPGHVLFDNGLIDFRTKGYDTSAGNLTYLDTKLLPSLNDENHLPVGEALDLTVAPGSALHSAIETALLTNHKTVTIVAGVQHDWDNGHAAWLNFNYLFNPKEHDPLRDDAGYDMNVAAGDGAEGSPWGGMANTQATPFAPQLIIVPEPSTFVLLELAGLALLLIRYR